MPTEHDAQMLDRMTGRTTPPKPSGKTQGQSSKGKAKAKGRGKGEGEGKSGGKGKGRKRKIAEDAVAAEMTEAAGVDDDGKCEAADAMDVMED